MVEHMLLGNNDHKRTGLYKAIHSAYNITKSGREPVPSAEPAISAGNWHGNETVYRTVYDLSKIIFLSDKNGTMQETPQRRFFSIIDGIIAGEKKGPLEPSPKPCGVILGGFDPIAVDLTATRLMGFNPERMVVFNRLSMLPPDHPLQPLRPEDIQIISNYEPWNRNIFNSNDRYLNLTPHHGWRNYLEIF
jgi:hypothetical protein